MNLIFVPGWATDETAWGEVSEELSPCFPCRCVSWHNAIGGEADNVLLSAISECDGPAVLIGWSLGSMIAIEAALQRPERIKGVVLISGTAKMTSADGYEGADPRTIRSMKARIVRDPDTVLKNFARLCISPEEEGTFVADFLAMGESFSPADLARGLEYLKNTDLRSSLQLLKMPALVLHGSEDRVIQSYCGKYLASHISGASYTELEGKGHALPFTAAHRISELIKAFLNANCAE